VFLAVIASQTGWTYEQIEDQPDWFKEMVYVIIMTDKQKLFSKLEGMISLWSRKH
jgi:hypothetical protein